MWMLLAAAVAAPCTLSGTVRTPQGAWVGHPVALTRVTDGRAVEHRSVRTDATGRFSAELPADGTWWVSAADPMWVPASAERPCAAAAEPIALTLSTGSAVLRGQLVDSAGRPVVGQVVLSTPASDGTFASVVGLTVDARGGFETQLTGGQSASLYASAEGYRPAHERLELPERARRREVQLTLRRTGQVVGRVVDRRGRPVADAQLFLDARGALPELAPGDTAAPIADNVTPTAAGPEPAPAGPVGATGPDGRFTLSVPDGVGYSLAVAHPSGVVCQPDRHPLDEGQREGPVLLTLAPGRSIAGDVRDAAGRPVASVEVVWRYRPCALSGSTKTDARGVFSLHAVPDAVVELYLPDRTRATWVEALQTTAHLTLPP
jgi:hypothetical protein